MLGMVLRPVCLDLLAHHLTELGRSALHLYLGRLRQNRRQPSLRPFPVAHLSELPRLLLALLRREPRPRGLRPRHAAGAELWRPLRFMALGLRLRVGEVGTLPRPRLAGASRPERLGLRRDCLACSGQGKSRLHRRRYGPLLLLADPSLLHNPKLYHFIRPALGS